MSRWDDFTTDELVQLEIGDIRNVIVNELAEEIDRRIYHEWQRGREVETMSWEGTN